MGTVRTTPVIADEETIAEQVSDSAASRSLLDYWPLLCHRRWWFLLPAFCAWFAVWGASWLLPPVYSSQSSILVDRQRVPKEYVVPNVTGELTERLQSITQQILSRTELQRIITQYGLYSAQRARLSGDELADLMRKDIKIEAAPGKSRDDLSAFSISYSARTPQLAQQVTAELTSLFMDADGRNRKELSVSTTEFLGQQLDAAANSLGVQEAAIRDFKMHHVGELAAQQQTNLELLAGLQAQAQHQREALNLARQQAIYMSSLQEQYRAVQNATPGGMGQLPARIDQDLATLKSQSVMANAHYTPDHPDMLQLRSAITALENLRAQLPNDATDPSSPAPKPRTYAELQVATPFMQLDSRMKANEQEIQDRERELQLLDARIEQYRGRLNLTPVREQELADLARGYDQARSNYESLLAKKNQSQLATDLEKRQQGEQFRLLDPPTLPHKPSWPNRRRMLWLCLIVAGATGVVVTAGSELARPRVHHERDLKGLVLAPVLVRIPSLRSPEEMIWQARRGMKEWTVGAVMVMVVAASAGLTLYRG